MAVFHLIFVLSSHIFWPIKIISHVNYLQLRYLFQVCKFTLFSLIFSCFSAKLRSPTFLTFSFIFLYLCFSFKIVLNSLWLFSMLISAWGTKVSMLFSWILLCFFFSFFAMLSNFFIIPVVREKIRVKLAPAIPTGVPTTLTKK